MANQGAKAAGELAAFSWATTSSGSTGIGAMALTQARRDQAAVAWRLEAAEVPGRTATDPTLILGEGTVVPRNDISTDAGAVAESTPELDRWETDGGTSPTLIDRSTRTRR